MEPGRPAGGSDGPRPRPDLAVSLRRLYLLLAAILACAAGSPAALRAQQADVIRGRIIGPDSAAVQGAQITVTSISGNVNRTARTDRNGRYQVVFPNGDGDYMVTIAALGFAAKRFEIKRVADEEILIADAKLSRIAQQLDAVKVAAERQRVNRNDMNQPDVSGTDRPVTPAQLPAADLGDLAAMAATLPGVSLVPGQEGDPNGYSVLGLGADQNNTTLNGMSWGGSNLPRDAAVSTSVASSPYDVSRGGFSGAQMGLRTQSGSNFQTRGVSLNLDAPQTQWTDRAAASLGQQYTNVSVGGRTSGPISFDKAFYNLSYQAGRRMNDFQSLLNTDPIGLQAAGVASDSVARLLDLLRGAGIPSTVGGFPSSRTQDQASLFGSLDFAPPSSTRGNAYNVTVSGGWNRLTPLGAGMTSLPANASERQSWNGSVQGRHNGYFLNSLLSETTFGAQASSSDMSPFLAMPTGRVRINSSFDDGTSGVQNLSFGGSPAMQQKSSNSTVGFLNQLSWFSKSNTHRLKLTTELRREGMTSEQGSNLLGSWTYNSLADLEANKPVSYSRTFSPQRRSMSQLVGGVSLGDAWRKSNTFQLQYGVRVDGNQYFNEPGYNAEIESLFGVRNDRAPSAVYVSPRVGFSWSYGQAAQIAGFEGAFRGPRAVVRGGAGVFQGLPSTGLLGSALDNTGLPSGLQQIGCIGAATPIPDWDAYRLNPGLVPDACADGTSGSVFSNSAPNVSLFAKDYKAPKSLRSNLSWGGAVLNNRFSLGVEAMYSYNINQPSQVDLNFEPSQDFSVDNEGSRPVYVPASSIVPATGAIALRSTRVATKFARVTEYRSDLESESRQLSFRLSPVRFNANFNWNVAYVWQNVRDQVRGFTSSTTGNPFDVEWARSSMDARHQFTYNLGYNLLDVVRISYFGRLQSGTPYTPLVAGDINGDGSYNDRAFIFDPSTSGDAQLAADMRAMLNESGGAVRECLRKQVGRLAGRNTCQGPWTSYGGMSFTFNPLKVRMPQRATLSFSLSNPLGAADLLLNGSSNLKGWGQQPIPDPSLLYVRGFDAATGRYKYEVNRRFGATSPQYSAFRSPVTLTAMMRFDVGPMREKQLLTQQLNRGRTLPGQRTPEPLLRAMYTNGAGIPNPVATILRQMDTLKLTQKQADSLATLNRYYAIKVDSIWSPFANWLVALPERYDEDDAYDRYVVARRATVDLLSRMAPLVKGLLSAEQQRKIPPFLASYLEPRYLASIRNGTATFTGGGMPGMMGGGGAVEVIRMGGGGGGAPMIIRQ